MPAPIDLTGHVYGRLTVVREKLPKSYPRLWECLCTCGTSKAILGASMRSGMTQSCGCLNKERVSAASTIHGLHGSPTYNTWHGMQQRCYNPNNHAYAFYGALGIGVCDEWADYPAFYQWAISNGYEEGLTLDRIEGTKNYCPDNCRWATKTTQARNQKMRNTNSSGFTGVSYVERLQKYQAYLTVNYKKISLGYFTDPAEAYKARQDYIQNNALQHFPK